MREWQKEGRGRKMCTARPKWMSITLQPQNYKERMFQVSISAMRNILDIDAERLVVRVEPSVEIGYLNRALVEEGFTLPVVPELDQLTVGTAADREVYTLRITICPGYKENNSEHFSSISIPRLVLTFPCEIENLL